MDLQTVVNIQETLQFILFVFLRNFDETIKSVTMS